MRVITAISAVPLAALALLLLVATTMAAVRDTWELPARLTVVEGDGVPGEAQWLVVHLPGRDSPVLVETVLLEDGTSEVMVVVPGFLPRTVAADAFEVELIAGDLNGDGRIDGEDLSQLSAAIGAAAPGHIADFNRDGKVDILDIATVARNFGATTESYG